MIPVPVGRVNVRPETAGLIACLGGALVVVETLLYPPPGDIAVAGFIVGLGIIALGASAPSQNRRRPVLGAAVTVLGFVSLLTVSGFFLGAILAIAGGLLLATLRAYAFGASGPRVFRGDALGPPCPKCGHHVPTWSAKCPYCGFPDTVTE